MAEFLEKYSDENLQYYFNNNKLYHCSNLQCANLNKLRDQMCQN